MMAQHRRAGQYRIRRRGLERHTPVAIAVNAELQNILGQHLDHADLTSPGAGGRSRIEIAKAGQADGGQDLRLKELRPAAIMRQCQDRIAG